jgi:hypothetical protein
LLKKSARLIHIDISTKTTNWDWRPSLLSIVFLSAWKNRTK